MTCQIVRLTALVAEREADLKTAREEVENCPNCCANRNIAHRAQLLNGKIREEVEKYRNIDAYDGTAQWNALQSIFRLINSLPSDNKMYSAYKGMMEALEIIIKIYEDGDENFALRMHSKAEEALALVKRAEGA